MEQIIVQIYEVQTPEEAEQLAALGVDHLGGVILSDRDWRNPLLAEAIEVARTGKAKFSLIPLFSTLDAIERVLDFYRPDIIHFCEALMEGTQVAAYCNRLIANQKAIKRRYPAVTIMRSVPIAPPGQTRWVPTLDLASRFESVSDFFLTDTLLVDRNGGPTDHQPVKGFVGITGRTCDWDMAANLVQSSRIPVILAGGLTPDNVFDGVAHVKPAGVDSCTGTNAVDASGQAIRFQKDLEKVRRFVDTARRAQSSQDPASG